MEAMQGRRCRLGASRAVFASWPLAGLVVLRARPRFAGLHVAGNAYDSGFEDLFLAKRNVRDWSEAMQRWR